MPHIFLYTLLLVLVTPAARSQNPGFEQETPVLDPQLMQNTLNALVTQVAQYGYPVPPQVLQAILTQVLLRLPQNSLQQQHRPVEDLPVDTGIGEVPPDTAGLSNVTAAVTTTPTPTTTDSEGKVTSPDDSGSSRPGPPASPGNDDTAQQHDRDEICRQPPVTGFCRGYMPSFHYDPATQQCHQFIYGGCGGNPNRFKTEKACLDFCRPAAGPPLH